MPLHETLQVSENASSATLASIQEIFSSLPIPSHLMDALLSLSEQYGPELLTGVLGWMSIHLINKGSSEYGEAASQNLLPDDQEQKKLDASRNILVGTTGMAAIAFAAHNPLFAFPEVAALLGSLLPYLQNKSETLRTITEKVRANIAMMGIAIATGLATASQYVQRKEDLLPIVGLTALSCAFALGGGKGKEGVYRTLTIGGGIALVIGSVNSGIQSLLKENSIGTIMSSVFFALNTGFTWNELKEVRKKREE